MHTVRVLLQSMSTPLSENDKAWHSILGALQQAWHVAERVVKIISPKPMEYLPKTATSPNTIG